MSAIKILSFALLYCFAFIEAKVLTDSTITKPDGRPRSWRVGAPRTATQIDEPVAYVRPAVNNVANSNPNVFQDTPANRNIQNAVISRPAPAVQQNVVAAPIQPVVQRNALQATPIVQRNVNSPIREKSAAELFPKTAPVNPNVYHAIAQLQPLAIPFIPIDAKSFSAQYIAQSEVKVANAPATTYTNVGIFGVPKLSNAEQNELISQIGGLNRTILGIPLERAKVEIRSTGLLTVYADGIAVRRYLLQNIEQLPKTAQVLIIGSKGINRRYALNMGFRGATQEDLQQMEAHHILSRDERLILQTKINPDLANQNLLVLVATNVESSQRPSNHIGIDIADLDEIYRILTIGTPVFFLP